MRTRRWLCCVALLSILGLGALDLREAPARDRSAAAPRGAAPATGSVLERTTRPRVARAVVPAFVEPSFVEAFPDVRVARDAEGVEIADRELLVVAEPGRGDDVVAGLRERLPVRAIARLPRSGLVRARLEGGVDLRAALADARRLDGVADVATNAILRGTDRRRAPALARRALWNVDAMQLPGRALRRGADERADYVVALLDSGVAYREHAHDDGRTHGASPGLASVEIVAPFDAVEGDPWADDENGHGTFLANLLVGAPGLAHGAALMPVRVLDADLIGTEAALIEGLAHARDHGADVVNLSLVLDAAYLPTRMLDAAIAEALASGLVIVAAAGNDGAARVRYPAAFPGVIAVGASTPASVGALTRAPYSSHGAALDLLAPGGDLGADANRDGVPDGILAESFDPQEPARFAPWIYAGTSQAAAHASAAALYLLADDVAPAAIAGHLREGARGGAFDPERGGGMLRVRAALHRHVELPRVGAQTLVVLVDREDGSRGALAPVVLLDEREEPLSGARVHGRFRGSVEETAVCTTAHDGTCALASSAFAAGPALVALEIEAVVLRDGRAVRPATLTSVAEREAVLEATDGAGFGSSSTVWSIDPSRFAASFSFSTYFSFSPSLTYFAYGSGAGSALAPTFIAFDEAVARALETGEASGAGVDDLHILPWEPDSFLGAGTTGGGFGSSSTVWSGWSFSWLGWGSPVYRLFGAHEGRIAAR